MHHEGNCYMKILISLLFCFMSSVLSYGQNDLVQNAIPLNPSGSESLLDTSNMYNSRYGAVARLTQDNMPCIMPNAFVTPIPNAAKRRPAPDKMPNFWKGQPWKYRPRPNKYIPIPEIPLKPERFKAPWLEKKDMTPPIALSDNEKRLKFYLDKIKQKQP